MLKKIILFSLFFIGTTALFSQEIDQRLLKKYSKKELLEMQKNDPQEYQFLINALDKGLFICEIPSQKGKEVTFDGTLKIDPTQTHTYISLGKEITDKYQYYRIEGTTKMLVIQPKIFLDKRVLNSKK